MINHKAAKNQEGNSPEPVILCWSGGKDSTYCLEKIIEEPTLDVIGLLTTVTPDRISIPMHGVSRELLEQQAKLLNLPLEIVPIQSSETLYKKVMLDLHKHYKDLGVSKIIFGDIWLDQDPDYREKNLASVGMMGVYPLWEKDPHVLASEIIRKGYRSIVVSVDPKQLDPSFCGREFDEQFLEDLPRNVDPCGENGEFHTFVYDGPIFKTSSKVEKGDVYKYENIWYCHVYLVD